MADQYRSEAEVKPTKNSKCVRPGCKRKATLTIASARGNSYAYVPVCKQDHDDYVKHLDDPDESTVRDAVSNF